MEDTIKAYSFALIASLIVGITTVMIKIVLQEINQLSTIVYLHVFEFTVSMVLITFIRKRDWIKPFREHWRHMSLYAIFSAIGIIVITYAIDAIGPSLTSFLTRFVMIFTIIIGFFFLKERFNKPEALGMVLAVIGAFMITYTTDEIILMWTILVIGVCALLAFTQLIVKTHIKKIDYFVLNHIRIVSNFFIVAALAITTSSLQVPSVGNLLMCAVAGLGGGIVGFVLFYKALEIAEMSKVNIIRVADPFLVVLFSFILLSSIPTTLQLLGGLVIAAGVAVMVIARQKPKIVERWVS
jgi:drug/metabolite transporter (DMT)-like permease